MSSKKLNITIPAENLKLLDEFCKEEKMNKSFLIREATLQYIENFKKQKEIERKKAEMKKAIEMMKKLRENNPGFKENKNGTQIIREIRDSR